MNGPAAHFSADAPTTSTPLTPSPPRTTGSAAWQQASNILLVRLDNLGDVLMTTPAFHAVRGDAPRRLTLLTSRAGAALEHHLASVDDVLTFDAPWVKGPPGRQRSASHDRRFIGKLARQRFDAAIIFTVCTQSALPAALLCRLAGIPLRLAFSRENPYDLLTDWVRDTETIGHGMQHEVERQLALVRTVGFEATETGLSFRCLPADVGNTHRKLVAAGGDPSAPYGVVHVGSSAPSRRYPPERFGQAARRIAQASGLQIVFTGGTDEQASSAAAQAAMGLPSISLAGALSVGELAALIDAADIALCNNSGPAHLAAALGTPLVVTYALTNPQHTPWQVPCRVLSVDVPCRNCLQSTCPRPGHECLNGIDADTVAEAVLDLLAEVGSSSSAAAACGGDALRIAPGVVA